MSPPRSSLPEGVILEPQGVEDDPPLDDEAVTCSKKGGQTHGVKKG